MSFICSSIFSFVCPFFHSFIHSFIHLSVHSFIHSSMLSFICLSILSFIHPFFHSSVCPFFHSIKLSCRCKAWHAQRNPPSKRTCKHLKDYLGAEFEKHRCELDTPKQKAALKSHINVSLLLAHKYDEK